ncbi:MAG TPA: TRAM domain-containing protein [Kiritimatiellia bacterium]|nr:TRAM domain-containing protein [Kiritimatiellia bacterium]
MNARPVSGEASRNVLLALLLVCVAAIAAVLVLVLKPAPSEPEAIITLIETQAPEEVEINVMQVVDAIEDENAKAEEGRRFKVLVTDESRAGASGITRIGGMVTFVPNTRRGDVVVIEVTRVKSSTADAVVVERLETGRVIPAAPPIVREERPRPESYEPTPELVGQVFTGKVTDVGREGDGVLKQDGKVIFIADAKVGETVVYRITDDAGRFAKGEVVSKVEATPRPPREPRERREQTKPPESPPPVDDKPVKVGEVHEVTVTERDRRNPDQNGVARIDNFVIFVPESKPGDRVKIRITEVRPRMAVSEVIERLGFEPDEQ